MRVLRQRIDVEQRAGVLQRRRVIALGLGLCRGRRQRVGAPAAATFALRLEPAGEFACLVDADRLEQFVRIVEVVADAFAPIAPARP